MLVMLVSRVHIHLYRCVCILPPHRMCIDRSEAKPGVWDLEVVLAWRAHWARVCVGLPTSPGPGTSGWVQFSLLVTPAVTWRTAILTSRTVAMNNIWKVIKQVADSWCWTYISVTMILHILLVSAGLQGEYSIQSDPETYVDSADQCDCIISFALLWWL